MTGFPSTPAFSIASFSSADCANFFAFANESH
jgi:hypothetical protein